MLLSDFNVSSLFNKIATVSILVLMDVTLGLEIDHRKFHNSIVSILVLMDVTLGHNEEVIAKVRGKASQSLF